MSRSRTSGLLRRLMIALIAHDTQKDDLLEFVSRHLEFFQTRQLVATGNTGRLLHDRLGLHVERVTHGPYGGDLIIKGCLTE